MYASYLFGVSETQCNVLFTLIFFLLYTDVSLQRYCYFLFTDAFKKTRIFLHQSLLTLWFIFLEAPSHVGHVCDNPNEEWEKYQAKSTLIYHAGVLSIRKQFVGCPMWILGDLAVTIRDSLGTLQNEISGPMFVD